MDTVYFNHPDIAVERWDSTLEAVHEDIVAGVAGTNLEVAHFAAVKEARDWLAAS